jgi:hypothetical protein
MTLLLADLGAGITTDSIRPKRTSSPAIKRGLDDPPIEMPMRLPLVPERN